VVADAEVIALAARCLEATGLRRYQVDVGHAEFFKGIMDAVKLPEEVKASVRDALAARDFVALEELLERTSLRSAEHELLLRFPALRGGAEILDAAGGLVRNRRSELALSELARVLELLAAHGLGDVVSLDLGAIRDFDYYTGIIFEGYGPDLGRPVAQGGRYDGLLGRFGRPAPATGFVVQLDLVWEMLTRAARPPALPRLDAAVAWEAPGLADGAPPGIDASVVRDASSGGHRAERKQRGDCVVACSRRRQPHPLPHRGDHVLVGARPSHAPLAA